MGLGPGIHPYKETHRMHKLVVITFLTLDGVMQAPGGPGEDDAGDFADGGWSVTYWDDGLGEVMDGFMGSAPFDLLLDRKTYEIFAAHWPHASDGRGAGPLNTATKYAVSTPLASAEWSPSVLISKDVAAQISRLKEQDGPVLQVHGRSQLTQTLIAHDLFDEYRLTIFPLLLGSGKGLLVDGVVPAGLRLVDGTMSTSGGIAATYERAGAISYGSFNLDQATAAEVEPRR